VRIVFGNPRIETLADQKALKSNLLAPRTRKPLCEPPKLIAVKHSFLGILGFTQINLSLRGTKSDKIRFADTLLPEAVFLYPLQNLIR
jgi:hypothetical protein